LKRYWRKYQAFYQEGVPELLLAANEGTAVEKRAGHLQVK
jgi:hypothetical protein